MKLKRIDSISMDQTYYTEEGYLVDHPIVTTCGIFEYKNDDGSTRRELRLPENVFDKKSLESYKGKPIIITHDAGEVDKENVRREQIGTIMSEGYRDGDSVRCEIIIHDTNALKSCGLKELSLGYSLDTDDTPGVYHGEKYDCIQKNIEINHLALVGEARAGETARLNIDGKDDDTQILKGGKVIMYKPNSKGRRADEGEELTPEEMEVAVFSDDKQTREENIRKVTEKMEEAFADNEEWLPLVGEAVYQYQKKTVRKMILKDHKRPDGRAITQIRPLAAEVDIIPRVHGSAMFTRGQTQICNVCTLAPLSEQQKIDGLDENEVSKRYMHHYNFPSYSVGETKPSRGPGRREIGHGALAERALIPVLPSEDEFPYAIRTVSETFESNGSTSMASTCASCMSLMAAGVPIKKMVAGISCGLVTGETDDDYLVLTDIQGLEDFFGDMDFKVTGTHDGITAIQMDIKIHGLTRPIVEEAIARTREARVYIMDEVMSKAIAEPRKEVNQWAPKIEQITIDPNKIGDVVGQKGKTINEIIARTGVKIDITDDGAVSVCGTDKEAIAKAIDMIKIITTDFKEGQIFTGTVVSIKEFGAFIEFAPGKEGMVHISKIAKERIEHVEDVLTLGDVVKVVCLGKDKMGRISFSIKDVPADQK